ncbi:hypothetical protein BC829DRAFT_440570 [Chytridium lagenaria]|nr:hypothetical protein BC829DRAFT_440570 [Chytridium lagenaria]
MLTTSSDSDDELFNLAKKRPIKKLVERPPRQTFVPVVEAKVTAPAPNFDSDSDSDSSVVIDTKKPDDEDDVVDLDRTQLAKDGLENWTSVYANRKTSTSPPKRTASQIQAAAGPLNTSILSIAIKFLSNDKDTFEMVIDAIRERCYPVDESVMLAYQGVEVSPYSTPASLSTSKEIVMQVRSRADKEHAQRLEDLSKEEEVISVPTRTTHRCAAGQAQEGAAACCEEKEEASSRLSPNASSLTSLQQQQHEDGDLESPETKSPLSEEGLAITTSSPKVLTSLMFQTFSLGTNMQAPAENLYGDGFFLENELAEAMSTPQALDYPQLLPISAHGIEMGWDVHSFMPRTHTSAAIEPSAPPALVWDEDLHDHFDGLRMEEESPVIIEGLSDELLANVYINAQLATHPQLVEEFRGTASNFPPGDIFFDRLKAYELALIESARSKVRLQVLISSASSLATKVWTLRKIPSHAEDRCFDGVKVRHIFTSEVSVLNEPEVKELDTVLASIRHETFAQNKRAIFKSKLIKLWIQNHIDESLSSLVGEEAEARLRRKEAFSDIEKETLKHFLDVLFFFERKSFFRTNDEGVPDSDAGEVCATPFVKDVRGWITHLMSAFLSRATLEDQRYILLHYLRTEGIGRWGASFIQWPLPKPWTETYLSHYLTVLNAVLSPVEEVEEVLKVKQFEIAEIRDGLKLLEDLDWIVVDDRDVEEELSPVKATILDEDDYLALLDQLNTMPIYISYLQEALSGQIHSFSVETDIDSLFLHIFAVTNHIQNSLSRGLSLFSSKHYPFMVKRIAQLSTDRMGSAKSGTDLNLEIKSGYDSTLKTSIQAELDSCFVRTVKMLLGNPRKGVWPFLASLKLDFVSKASKWKLLSQIVLASQNLNGRRFTLDELLARFDEDWGQETGIFSLFESNTNEIVHLITFLANLVVEDNVSIPLASTPASQPENRREPFLDLAVIISRVIFVVSYTSSYHRDVLSKPARDLLHLICETHKPVTSYLLTWTRDKFADLGTSALYLFSDLPINLWQPTYADFSIIQSMLKDPITTAKFRLAKFIVNHLDWGTRAGELVIGRPYHRMIAIAVANIFLDRQSVREARGVLGGATAYASTAMATVGSMATGSFAVGEKDDFNEWCWSLIMRLNLYQRPQSVDIYALEFFSDGTRPFESLESSTIATLRGAMKTNALAAYTVMMISELGYNFNLFEKEGWPLLHLLAEGGFVKPVLRVINDIMFSFAKTHGIGVLKIGSSCRLSKNTYKGDAVEGDVEVMKLCVGDIASPFIMATDRELLICVFSRLCLRIQNGWGIDIALRKEYNRLLANHMTSQATSSRFSLLHPVESVKSIALTFGEMYYGYPSLIVGSERLTRNGVGEGMFFGFAVVAVLVEVEAEKEGGGMWGMRLVAYQILETTETHPTMPILLQIFLHWYFERSKEVLSSSFSRFGYRFFQEKKDMGVSSELLRLYHAMSLWLKEKRLASNDVYVDHLSPAFFTSRLRDVLAGDLSKLWMDLMPMGSVERRVRGFTEGEVVVKRRGSILGNKVTTTEKYLKSVSPALPPPILSLRPPSVTRLADYSLKVGGDVMKTAVPFITGKAQRFLEIVEEQVKCDGFYVDALKTLYINESKRGRIEKNFTEVRMLMDVKNVLKENRVSSDGLFLWDNMDPQVCVSALRLLRMVDWICLEIHDAEEGLEGFARQVFYDVLKDFSSNLKKGDVEVFGMRNKLNGGLLARIFHPAVALVEFPNMYLEVHKSVKEDRELAVLFFGRFDVAKWMESAQGSLTLEFLKVVLECMDVEDEEVRGLWRGEDGGMVPNVVEMVLRGWLRWGRGVCGGGYVEVFTDGEVEKGELVDTGWIGRLSLRRCRGVQWFGGGGGISGIGREKFSIQMQADVHRQELMSYFERIWMSVFGMRRNEETRVVEVTPWMESDIVLPGISCNRLSDGEQAVSTLGFPECGRTFCVEFYAWFVEGECPAFVLDMVQTEFLKLVPWESFTVSPKVVEDVAGWIGEENQYPLLLSMLNYFSTICVSRGRRSGGVFDLLEGPLDGMGGMAILPVIEFCSNRQSVAGQAANPLSFALELLRLLTGITSMGDNDTRVVAANVFAKLEVYVDYTFDVVAEQTSIKGDSTKPIESSIVSKSFTEIAIGIFFVETVDFVATIPNSFGELKANLLQSTTGRMYAILNTCPKSSKEYPLIWAGVRQAISVSNDPTVWLSSACRLIASAEYMALTAELCIERDIMGSLDRDRWGEITRTLVVPELEAEGFIRHCLGHALILTLYAQALQKLDECLKMESIEEGKEGKALLLLLKFSDLLREELSALPLPEHHSRLRAHLPAMADSLIRWGQDRANQGLWATLELPAAFLAIRLLGTNGGRKEEEQKLTLIESVSSVAQNREFENCWGKVEEVVAFLRDESGKGLHSFSEMIFLAGNFSNYSSLGVI